MKKILIVSHVMEIGGAERALIGLLNSIDYKKYQIDLFLCRHEGELLSSVPAEVNLLPMNQARFLAVPMKNLLKQFEFKMLYGRLKGKYLARKRVQELKLSSDNQVELTYSHKYTCRYVDYIEKDTCYDLAISFLTPHYICMEKVNAKKKIAWIHTDYSTIDVDIEAEIEMWDKYDWIASISDACTKAFLSKFPSFGNKIIRIDNIITDQMIQEQAEQFSVSNEMPEDSVRLLSVGRFSYAKNFDNVPEICKKLMKYGLNVKWYLVGYGGDEQLIRSKIEEYGMEKNVIILGKKDNPYPYIKACDIYVQPSRYEGKSVTVREAQILHKPVIITDFPTAKAHLKSGYDGIIVPMENQGCAEKILKLIKDKELQKKLIENTKAINYSNEDEIQKIYEIMGD